MIEQNASLPGAAGFYAVLLENRRWWHAELAAEGMMDLSSLPSPSSTNGTVPGDASHPSWNPSTQ